MSSDNPLAPAGPSPLTEASPQSLAKLFSSDPYQITDTELDLIIAEHRKQRQRIAQADAAGTKTPRAKKAPLASGEAPSLSELDL